MDLDAAIGYKRITGSNPANPYNYYLHRSKSFTAGGATATLWIMAGLVLLAADRWWLSWIIAR